MASHREILKANRRARRKRYFRRSVTVVIFFAIILLIGGWYLWNHPSFVLTRIIVVGTEIIWGTPRIEVSERRPAALWCDSDCYYLDSTGLVYSPAPQFSNNPLLVLTGLSLPIPIGSRPLAISDFEHLLKVRAAINRLLQTAPDLAGQTIEAVSLTEPVDYTFNVRNVRLMSVGWRLLTVRRDPVETIVSRLAAAFSAPAFLAAYRLSGVTFDYLDIRFDRKVFYKFMP